MYLLEHDAKSLLESASIAVPCGVLLERGSSLDAAFLPAGPWVVKGQVAAGGRGKAGLVKKAATVDEVARCSAAMFGAPFKGRRIESVRVEQQIASAAEVYIAFMVDAAAGGVRVIVSEQGGMEIEAVSPEHIRSATVPPDIAAIVDSVERLTAGMAGGKAAALTAAARKLAPLFFEREAALIEINPLFVMDDGAWIAADAKIVTDDNALERQPALLDLLAARAVAYPEAWLKQQHGFDYVVVDPQGEIGLLTTGAGLSMMLIDELRSGGLRPYNFLDIRTGGFRGDPGRLVSVLGWLREAPSVKALLINIFAGITDLGEFATLLVKAFGEGPALKVPIVARLEGTNLDAAQAVLAQAGIPFYTELDPAVEHLRKHLASC
jgi:succinyl-CoA synthetase beta subunit